MPILKLFESEPEEVLKYDFQQIVTLAGDGKLVDGGTCQKELRAFLRKVESEKLFEYAEFCLGDQKFPNSGFALQDIVNELGHRLDYEIEFGPYHGKTGEIGNDGLWESKDEQTIVVEVKTTDVFKISLDTLAGYKNKLLEKDKIKKDASILIVVGHHGTDDLESQIRGSRYAWDIRVISVKALCNLVRVNVKSDEDKTTRKIRSILKPIEYTLLDELINILFATAQDVEISAEELSDTENGESTPVKLESRNHQGQTPKEIRKQLKKDAIYALGKRENTSFTVSKKTKYTNETGQIRAVVLVSKINSRSSRPHLWYGLRDHQIDYICEAECGFLLLIDVENKSALCLGSSFVKENLRSLKGVDRGDYIHRHLQVNVQGSKYEYELVIPKAKNLDLTPYKLEITKHSEA